MGGGATGVGVANGFVGGVAAVAGAAAGATVGAAEGVGCAFSVDSAARGGGASGQAPASPLMKRRPSARQRRRRLRFERLEPWPRAAAALCRLAVAAGLAAGGVGALARGTGAGVGSGVGADEATTVGAADGVGRASSVLTLASRDGDASALAFAKGLAAGVAGSVAAAAAGVDVDGAAAILVGAGLAIEGAPASARLAMESVATGEGDDDRQTKKPAPAAITANAASAAIAIGAMRRPAAAGDAASRALCVETASVSATARRLQPLRFEPRALRLAQSADRDDQRLHVGAKTLVRQARRVAPRERLQRVGKLLRPRHFGAVDQHRDDVLAQALRGFDLDPNPIVGIVEPAAAVDVDDIGPAPADDSEKDVALLDAGRQFLGEIATRRDIVDVDENALARERGLELVVEPSCGGLVLAASVIDEDALGHRRRSRG